MGKTSSRLLVWSARLVKVVMVVVAVPVAVGLLRGVLQQTDAASASGGTWHEWIQWGFMTYVWIHLLLFRPQALFRASHRLFSVLAGWVFGGQVASVETSGGKGKSAKGVGEPGQQGSTLVAFSPYVIPLSVILVCALAWLLAHWVDRVWLDAPASFLIGLTAAFHWLMTAEALQQQRSRWHLETYLLAIGLVFVVSLLIGGSCLTWAIPGYAFLQALADGLAHAQAIYTTLVQRLFL